MKILGKLAKINLILIIIVLVYDSIVALEPGGADAGFEIVMSLNVLIFLFITLAITLAIIGIIKFIMWYKDI
ncbi:MAG: hypothetical protein IJL89_11575, partial [Firmicutes bacterium]|nr:hypothetical protein [Bacillota bacterium]